MLEFKKVFNEEEFEKLKIDILAQTIFPLLPLLIEIFTNFADSQSLIPTPTYTITALMYVLSAGIASEKQSNLLIAIFLMVFILITHYLALSEATKISLECPYQRCLDAGWFAPKDLFAPNIKESLPIMKIIPFSSWLIIILSAIMQVVYLCRCSIKHKKNTATIVDVKG